MPPSRHAPATHPPRRPSTGGTTTPDKPRAPRTPHPAANGLVRAVVLIYRPLRWLCAVAQGICCAALQRALLGGAPARCSDATWCAWRASVGGFQLPLIRLGTPALPGLQVGPVYMQDPPYLVLYRNDAVLDTRQGHHRLSVLVDCRTPRPPALTTRPSSCCVVDQPS